MLSSGYPGRFPTLQIGIKLHHVVPEVILPPGQILLVSHDLLGTEPPVGSDWDKRKVHVGRFLVHMHHGGNKDSGGLFAAE